MFEKLKIENLNGIMIDMRKFAQQRINFGIALLVIIAASTIPLVLFSGLVIFQMRQAEAVLGTDVGLQVLSAPIICVLDPLTERCDNCVFCGDVPTCEGNSEVLVRPLNTLARTALSKGQALCLGPGYQTTLKRGNFLPKSKCLGKVQFFPGLNLHKLFNFGCAP